MTMIGPGWQESAATEVPSRFFIAGLLIAIAVFFVTACSNSSPTSNASATPSITSLGGLPDPCSLLTQAEVETALGKGATSTSVYNERLGKQQCRLKPAAPGAIDEIRLSVDRAINWDVMKQMAMGGYTEIKSVSGLGDDAYWNRGIGYNVRKGDKYIQIYGAWDNNAAADEKATRYLAERASSRL
jgi:hypothetical protein